MSIQVHFNDPVRDALAGRPFRAATLAGEHLAQEVQTLRQGRQGQLLTLQSVERLIEQLGGMADGVEVLTAELDLLRDRENDEDADEDEEERTPAARGLHARA